MTKSFASLKKFMLLVAFLAMAMTLSLQVVAADTLDLVSYDGHDGDCVIPESGPWPPCATGGGSAPASSDDCVIPESGPWPPCATGGSTPAPAPAPGGDGDCVIPESGPWPPCATGGGAPAPAPAPGGDGDCVIPESGPWPPCATGGAPAPAPAPEEPAPSDPAAEEPIGVITLVYASDPEEVLGVFPVFEFNADTLFVRMLFNEVTMQIMRENLDGTLAGDQAACDRFEEAYEVLKASGGFYVDIPADWQGIHDRYVASFITALDRTRPAYLSCLNDGQVNEFNYGLAFTAIDEAKNILTPAIEEAAEKLGLTE